MHLEKSSLEPFILKVLNDSVLSCFNIFQQSVVSLLIAPSLLNFPYFEAEGVFSKLTCIEFLDQILRLFASINMVFVSLYQHFKSLDIIIKNGVFNSCPLNFWTPNFNQGRNSSFLFD